ncbi:hypothetical protein KP509_01G062600 [Ceratopteris richardii]|nr:hypothetical protein KP509_01G062600 [Ceratopteris richardii]
MKQTDFFPDAVTYTCVLKACGNMGDLRRGETIHEDIATQGLLLQNIELGNALVSMYAKCGAFMKARQVLEHLPFRNTVSWSALIAGYVQQGEDENALNCFNQMLREGHASNSVTLMCILKACSNLRAVDRGEQIHLQLVKAGLPREDIMLATALVDMYAKSGAIAKAWQVLDEAPMWDTASWNALISGSLEQGEAEKALEFFKQMDKKGLHPTAVTFICALKACGIMGALDEGKRIHDRIEKEGLLQTDIILGNALVDMYVKLGAVSAAHKVLKGLRVRDTISWNSFIAGLDMSHATYLLCCLEEMEADGFSPNAATLSCVLSSCCRSGLVDDAQLYFLTMTTKYCVKPDFEHFTCIIDLLGRAGHLDKAAELLKIIGITDVKVWSTLLSACQRWGNVNVGRWVFEEALQVA